MNIYPPGLRAIITSMSKRIQEAAASEPVDAEAIGIMASIISCAVHQLSLETADFLEVKKSAEELLRLQAQLERHDGAVEE